MLLGDRRQRKADVVACWQRVRSLLEGEPILSNLSGQLPGMNSKQMSALGTGERIGRG
jgi:hypothetical protein